MNLTLATHPKHAGRVTTHTVRGVTVTVTRVGCDDRTGPHDVVFQKYTADLRTYSARPFKVGPSSFATLDAAVAALVRIAQSKETTPC